jgi:hypothetical protein
VRVIGESAPVYGEEPPFFDRSPTQGSGRQFQKFKSLNTERTPMKKAIPSIVGDQRIVEREQRDREYLDAEVQAFVRFRKDDSGEFLSGQ